ncbi:MAG: hypothetical protein ABSF27_07285 [Candidatus Dormibacteria bacterium]
MRTPDLLPPDPSGRWARLRQLAWVDTTPLRRSADFRWLFVGQTVSGAGSMLTYVAVPYQAYRLTHSSLTVGLLSPNPPMR